MGRQKLHVYKPLWRTSTSRARLYIISQTPDAATMQKFVVYTRVMQVALREPDHAAQLLCYPPQERPVRRLLELFDQLLVVCGVTLGLEHLGRSAIL